MNWNETGEWIFSDEGHDWQAVYTYAAHALAYDIPVPEVCFTPKYLINLHPERAAIEMFSLKGAHHDACSCQRISFFDGIGRKDYWMGSADAMRTKGEDITKDVLVM